MTNSADPDQLASEEANRSGSKLFAKTGHAVLSKRRINIAGIVTDNRSVQMKFLFFHENMLWVIIRSVLPRHF